MGFTDDDARFMRRALALAARAYGRTAPNPMVGCVLVDRRGRIVGEGFHRRAGEAHAEVEALRAAGARARGATAYVTLEPCNHVGRTGPCTRAKHAFTAATSVASESRPCCDDMTPYPSASSVGINLLKHEPSAQRPCAKTMLGLD